MHNRKNNPSHLCSLDRLQNCAHTGSRWSLRPSGQRGWADLVTLRRERRDRERAHGGHASPALAAGRHHSCHIPLSFRFRVLPHTALWQHRWSTGIPGAVGGGQGPKQVGDPGQVLSVSHLRQEDGPEALRLCGMLC